MNYSGRGGVGAGSCYVAQAAFELSVFLSPPPGAGVETAGLGHSHWLALYFLRN